MGNRRRKSSKEFIEDYLSLIDELELKNALLTQGKRIEIKQLLSTKKM